MFKVKMYKRISLLTAHSHCPNFLIHDKLLQATVYFEDNTPNDLETEARANNFDSRGQHRWLINVQTSLLCDFEYHCVISVCRPLLVKSDVAFISEVAFIFLVRRFNLSQTIL